MTNVELAIGILKNELETSNKEVWAEIADFVTDYSDIKEHLEEMAKYSSTYDVVYDCIDYLKRTAEEIESECIADGDTEKLLRRNGFMEVYDYE